MNHVALSYPLQLGTFQNFYFLLKIKFKFHLNQKK